MGLKRGGFTLVELLVVVLIVGILAAISVPQYNKSVETSKAEAAASTLTMIGQAQRMFQLDLGSYVANGTMADSCNSKCCWGGGCSEPATDRCQLVACKYLASQPWDGASYYFQAGTSVTCGVSASCPSGASRIACARRQGASAEPYASWGYIYCSDGSIKWDSAKGTPEFKL